MTKEELLKAIQDNMGLFDESEQGVLNDVLDYNKNGKGKPEDGKGEEKPEDEKKENPEEKPADGKEPDDGDKQMGSKPEDEAEDEKGKPEESPKDEASPEQPNQEEKTAQPQAMADPRVDAIVAQLGQMMAKVAAVEDAVSKIVVVRPAEEQKAGGYGESAKGNPANVDNKSVTDSIIASMGGYGR